MDIPICDQVIESVRGKTGVQVTEESHGKGWELVAYKESIPYEATFLSDEPITEHDMLRTLELATELGWE